ncbi:hypothetical protein LOD99_5107 [Oopsacas minuta]|uniref:UHRF1-binding protein 1-like n=1 Tax=Oopsacas minuta TaxID=111878 RepID=A0AAV7JSJ8_9METZ|nr:hypothetical protein LOD99_5107 [Oopsacas minuta]
MEHWHEVIYSSYRSKYGLTEKVLDSMFIEIEALNIEFTSTQFKADLFVSGITLKCTDHEFNNCMDNLVKSRPVNTSDQSVTVFRQLSFICFQAKATSTVLAASQNDVTNQSIRLNCDNSFVNFSLKKKLADCSHMCSKFIIQLGVLSFILNDSELKEASNFFQHLKQLHDLAKIMEQKQATLKSPTVSSPARQAASREPEAKGAQGLSKLKKRQTPDTPPQSHKLLTKKTSTGISHNFIQKDEEGKVDISASVMHFQSTLIHEDENIEAYQLGRKRIPPGLIVQTSIHFRVQKLDVHLCCQLPSSGLGIESTHMQFSGIGLDIYPDQKAGTQRHHWANYDYKFQDRTDWGMGLLRDTQKKVSRVQKGGNCTLMGVSLDKLRESVICFRCFDFSISPVTTGATTEKQRPFIASDKGSYKFGHDAPTIWIDFTAYFYPAVASEHYMIPRPNFYVCINPVQVTFYQETFLWFIKFVVKMAVTLKLGEEEGDKESQNKQKIGELTLIGKNQLKGMDIQVGTLMTKVTIPIAYPPEIKNTKDRPVAVQLDISEIVLKNRTAAELINSCDDLVKFLKRLQSTWFFKCSSEYPHSKEDLSIKPSILRDLYTLLNQKESNVKSKFGELEKMRKSQLWQIDLRHFSLSLVQSLTEEGVMRPDEFMEPITIQVWLATNIISHLKQLAELAKHLSDQESQLNDNPMIYFIVSLPDVVDVVLKQVVFLSIMRLKDTIDALKTDVQSEIRKMDRFNKDEINERGAEESTSPLLKISGIVGVDKVCVSLQLPIDLQKSVGTQTEVHIPDPAFRLSHSSLSNHEDIGPMSSRSGLHSVDEDLQDDQSALTSSISSEGSDVHIDRDRISMTSSQMNVFETDAVTIDQLQLLKPDFHNQSFFASFSQKIGVSIEHHNMSVIRQAIKPRLMSAVDVLTSVNEGENDVISNGQVLEKYDVLTHIFRVHLNNIFIIAEVVGEKLKVKGAITKLSFAEEPIKVEEFVDHCNAPRKYAKYLKNFPPYEARDEPVIKFIAELGNHVEEKYSKYSPPPSLSVDARVKGLCGTIYAAHLKDIKGVIKDDVKASSTTIPISLTLQDLNITLAELPDSSDSDILIGIEAMQLIRSPDYKLSIIESKQIQLLPEDGMQIQFRENILSDELRDEDTPLPQVEDPPSSFLSTSVVSSQSRSDFTEIEDLPEYTQSVLQELTNIKQKYEITLALNHNMKMELEDFRTNTSGNKEVFNKTLSDVQNLATKNSTLMKELSILEDRNRDLENEIADLNISKKSVESLLKSKVDNIEDSRKKSNSHQKELSNLKDTISSLQLNKQSLMEILERNSEEIRDLALRNHELESKFND